jgi:hypothetical protein
MHPVLELVSNPSPSCRNQSRHSLNSSGPPLCVKHSARTVVFVWLCHRKNLQLHIWASAAYWPSLTVHIESPTHWLPPLPQYLQYQGLELKIITVGWMEKEKQNSYLKCLTEIWENYGLNIVDFNIRFAFCQSLCFYCPSWIFLEGVILGSLFFCVCAQLDEKWHFFYFFYLYTWKTYWSNFLLDAEVKWLDCLYQCNIILVPFILDIRGVDCDRFGLQIKTQTLPIIYFKSTMTVKMQILVILCKGSLKNKK